MNVGVLLSGCGIGDGSQIEEVMLTYLALDKYGIDYLPMAPDKNQKQVMNHLVKQVTTDGLRNILVESARLGRGRIEPLNRVHPQDISALIVPGGLGVFQNLSNDSDVYQFIRSVHASSKPIVVMCAGVVLVAECLGDRNLTLSSANNAHLNALEKHHVQVVQVSAKECVVDGPNRIISTPAFLASQNLADIQIGIEKCIRELRKYLPVSL